MKCKNKRSGFLAEISLSYLQIIMREKCSGVFHTGVGLFRCLVDAVGGEKA
jgi:hypothetical protein